MPSGPRIRTDNVYGTTTDAPLTAGATTMNSAGLANLAAVSSAHAIIILDPLRSAGAPEAVVVTAHTGSATSATITRGAYGTSAREHAAGTLWVHAPTREDFIRIVTASTRPSDPYEGQLAYETDTNRWVGYDGAAWQPSPHNPPACRVYHDANQSINDNTVTTVAFNSERYDTDSMHDTASNNSRITFNKAGLYLVTFQGRFPAANDFSVADAHIRLNGSTVIAWNSGGRALSGSADLNVGVTTVYKFAAADYVEARVHQDNTANTARNLETVGNYSPEFMATWIGVG